MFLLLSLSPRVAHGVHHKRASACTSPKYDFHTRMLKRTICISARNLKAHTSHGINGEKNRFRSAFEAPKLSEAKQERTSSSPNRFKVLHDKNKQGNNPRHPNNNGKSKGKVYSQRNGSWVGAKRTEQTRQTFNISTGSERAQTALKSLIMKVKGNSKNYEVNHVDPKTKAFLKVSLQSLVNNLDLSKEGIRILPAQEDGNPIVRIIPVEEMIKTYSDELAAIKQKELLDMGSARALKVASMRAQAERKKSATKILTLSWSISVSDLLNQKKNEIEKRLKKDGKLIIFVGEKSSLFGARNNAEKEDALAKELKTSNTKWDKMDEEENFLEMKKRELVHEKLQEVLQDLDCKIETSGSLDTRMMIKLHFNGKTVPGAESTKENLTPKDLKRLKKQEKATERIKAKERTLAEEDIDSLYLLKIED